MLPMGDNVFTRLRVILGQMHWRTRVPFLIITRNL